MAFEKLIKNRRNVNDEPLVSIGAGGVIYLNTYVMRNYFAGIKNVVLLYDESRKVLAIQPATKAEFDAYRLNYSSRKTKSTGVIAARAQLKHLRIDYSKTIAFKGEWKDEEGHLEIKL